MPRECAGRVLLERGDRPAPGRLNPRKKDDEKLLEPALECASAPRVWPSQNMRTQTVTKTAQASEAVCKTNTTTKTSRNLSPRIWAANAVQFAAGGYSAEQKVDDCSTNQQAGS